MSREPYDRPVGEAQRWLDEPANIRKIVIALGVVCVGLLLADLFYEKHPHYAMDSLFGFYAIYGFVVCVGLVLAAKVMRIVLMRDENYYDSDR